MPVDAIQWRVSVGMGNAGRVCPTKWRCKLHLVKPTMEGLCYQLMVSMATVVLPLFFLLDAGPPGQMVYAGGSLCKSCVQAGYRIGCSFTWSTGVSGFCLQSHLQALSLLLVVAGDVEQNPGPLTDEFLANVDDTELTEGDVRDVYQAVLSLAGQWRDMCLFLGLKPSDEKIIDYMYPRDPKRCLREVVTKWLEKAYNTCKFGLPTWRTLVKAVSDPAGGNNPALAERISEKHQVIKHTESLLVASSENKAQYYPECILRYAEYLKKKYHKLQLFSDEKGWLLSQVIQSYETEVVLVEHEDASSYTSTEMRAICEGKIEKVAGKAKRINVKDIFNQSQQEVAKVLIDGAPGTGKTTLTRKFVQDWVDGCLLDHYVLVLLLPLRENQVFNACSIDSLFYHDDEDLQKEVVKYVKKTCGASVMLIFDGFDELSSDQREGNSLFLDIIRGEKLTNCSVVVTSRPYASSRLQKFPSITRHIELLVFSQSQIEICICSAIDDHKKANTLVQKLKERKDLISLCYIPLNCAIMIFVYKYQDYILPDTLTELYEMFLTNIVKREYPQQEHRIQNLCSLPDPVRKCLDALSELAYQGLIEDKSVFSLRDVELKLNCSTDISSEVSSKLLGLMTMFPSISGFGQEMYYQFIHLTIQEFLAARHATSMEPSEQVSLFERRFGRNRFWIVIRFLSGLSKLVNPAYKTYFERQQFSFTTGNKAGRYMNMLDITAQAKALLDILHTIYEAQNPDLCAVLSQTIDDQIICMNRITLTPFDCKVLTYFLIHSSCQWKRLELAYCGLTDLCLQVIRTTSYASSTSCQIEELSFLDSEPNEMNSRQNFFTPEGMLFIASTPLFEHTKVIELPFCLGVYLNELTVSDGFVSILQMRYLTSLSIREVRRTYARSLDLRRRIHSFSFHFGVELVTCTLCRFLSEHVLHVSHSLQSLSLTICEDCSVNIVEWIACAIGSSSITNFHLEFWRQACSGCPRTLSHLFQHLQSDKVLKGLHIGYENELCQRSYLDAQFQRMLAVNNTLMNLELHFPVISDSDLQHLTAGLTENTTLTDLSICIPYLPYMGSVQLLKSIHSNRSIIRCLGLFLNLPVFVPPAAAGDSLSIFKEYLWQNNCIQFVIFHVNAIWMPYIAAGLEGCHSLQTLHLSFSPCVVYLNFNVIQLFQNILQCPNLIDIGLEILLVKYYSPVPAIQTNEFTAPYERDSDHEREADLGKMVQALMLERDQVNINFFPDLIPLTPYEPPSSVLLIKPLIDALGENYPLLLCLGIENIIFHGTSIIVLFHFEALKTQTEYVYDSECYLPMKWESLGSEVSFEAIKSFSEWYFGHESEIQQCISFIGIKLCIGHSKQITWIHSIVRGKCHIQYGYHSWSWDYNFFEL